MQVALLDRDRAVHFKATYVGFKGRAVEGKEAAQLAKEAAEAERQVSYALGVEET